MRVRRALFSHTRRNRGYVPRPCPDWCEVDHDALDLLEKQRLHASNALARVSVWATDNLETGEWSETIVVDRANDLSGEQARALALEILDAIDVLEGGAR